MFSVLIRHIVGARAFAALTAYLTHLVHQSTCKV